MVGVTGDCSSQDDGETASDSSFGPFFVKVRLVGTEVL